MKPEDRALLRRFEPVMRFTRGERYFPADAEHYVRWCALWSRRGDEEPVRLVPEGKLTPERLAGPLPGDSRTVHYLKFAEPLDATRLAAYRLRRIREGLGDDARERFRAGVGRLARVGYLSRFADVLFSLTLLARGRVPGDTAAAASLIYGRMREEREAYRYYGRVLRQGGWTVLQYWFFYPFNDWRSGFYGVNDHEADWEMACVFLSGEDDSPEWAAYASHEYSGDDLRRRWDDPELEKVGEHPVIYVAAGSHASYFAPGEYLTEIELNFLTPLTRAANGLRKTWRRLTRQPRDVGPPHFHLSVPFVDYARGDGFSVGPGAGRPWDEPGLLDPPPPWASEFRGLWGLYTRDPVSGEDAPAGPLYDRDGTPRRAWYDPAGWAGLDKVPPPEEALAYTRERRAELEGELQELEAEISTRSRILKGLSLEAEAMRDQPHLKELQEAHEREIENQAAELAELRDRHASESVSLETLSGHEERLRAGERGPARAHLHRPHRPATAGKLRLNRLAEVWAALSIGLAMVVFVVLVLFVREYLVFGLAGLVSLLVLVEAGFRRRLADLVNGVTIALAVVAAGILLFEFFWIIVVLAVLAAAAYMISENLRELWS